MYQSEDADSPKLYAWKLEKGEQKRRVRVNGQFAFDNTPMMVRTALAG